MRKYILSECNREINRRILLHIVCARSRAQMNIFVWNEQVLYDVHSPTEDSAAFWHHQDGEFPGVACSHPAIRCSPPNDSTALSQRVRCMWLSRSWNELFHLLASCFFPSLLCECANACIFLSPIIVEIARAPVVVVARMQWNQFKNPSNIENEQHAQTQTQAQRHRRIHTQAQSVRSLKRRWLIPLAQTKQTVKFSKMKYFMAYYEDIK